MAAPVASVVACSAGRPGHRPHSRAPPARARRRAPLGRPTSRRGGAAAWTASRPGQGLRPTGRLRPAARPGPRAGVVQRGAAADQRTPLAGVFGAADHARIVENGEDAVSAQPASGDRHAAIDLGGDTDTVAAVTGGLAGLIAGWMQSPPTGPSRSMSPSQDSMDGCCTHGSFRLLGRNQLAGLPNQRERWSSRSC